MFYIIELQTNKGQGAYIVTTKETQNEAMSQYHTVLAAAAVSSVEKHACVVMDDSGNYLATECYEHGGE